VRVHGQHWTPETVFSVHDGTVGVCLWYFLLFCVERCVHVGGKHVIGLGLEQEIWIQNSVMHTELHTVCVLPCIYSADLCFELFAVGVVFYVHPIAGTAVFTIGMVHCALFPI